MAHLHIVEEQPVCVCSQPTSQAVSFASCPRHSLVLPISLLPITGSRGMLSDTLEKKLEKPDSS